MSVLDEYIDGLFDTAKEYLSPENKQVFVDQIGEYLSDMITAQYKVDKSKLH